MKRPNVRTVVLSCAGALVLASLWLLYSSPGARARRERAAVLERAQTDPAADAQPATLSVESIVARASRERPTVEVSAELEPVREVVVGAEVAGKVIEVVVEEHAHVAEGELLVRLDPELARAAVERARAGLVRAEAAERLARTELRRQRELSGRGVVSTAELDRAESEAGTTAAQVAEARAALVDASTRLSKTNIPAPFAGVVSRLDLEPGAYVQPGGAVAELVDLSEIEVEVGVGEREVLALERGDRVEVEVDVFPGERFEGRILRVGRAPDASTRKYPVPIRIANPDERLLPGMLGTVRLGLGDARAALEVPRRAVRREFELDYVFVLEPVNGATDPADLAVARRRRVATRPLPFRPDRVEVTRGLEAGERVAISRVRELRDGLRVTVLAQNGDS